MKPFMIAPSSWSPGCHERPGRTTRRQAGFGLLEVLIAVVILAVGMLGLAGMQVAGMKSNHSAYLRSQASFASYSLLDRMRTDPGAFAGQRFEFNTGADSGNVDFEAWEADLDPLFAAPDVADGSSASKGVVDCTDDEVPVNTPDDCTTGNVCGAGNCSICVRWSDSRGERVDPADADAADQRTAALEFRVCSLLPE